MPVQGPNAYPFDPTGQELSNAVVGEAFPITPVNSNENNFYIPKFAPFYRATLAVHNGATLTPLVEGVDFLFGYKYKEATINTAIPIYGCIIMLNKNYSGVIVMDYQTVGGQWTLTYDQWNTLLSDKMSNPRWTTWDNLEGTAPTQFPVIDHMHVDPEEMIGMDELVTAVEEIGVAISGLHVDIDYNAINAYADGKVQDSMSPSQTTVAPSVRAVLEAFSNVQIGVHIGPTPPPAAVVKQLWWNNNVGRMFIYYNDGDSLQWVETSPGAGGGGGNGTIFVGASAPPTPVDDMLWWNPTTTTMKIFYTADWHDINSATSLVHVGITAPVSPLENQLWWHSGLGKMLIRFNDGTSVQWVDTAAGMYATDNTPVGTIIGSGATTAPNGYLDCFGQTVSRTVYPDLFAAIGTAFNIGGESISDFRLPDTRGQFLRGLDNGAGIDPARLLGSYQEDMFEAHVHAMGEEFSNVGPGSGTDAGGGLNFPGPLTQSTGGTETRPKNVAVNFFIKAFGAINNPGNIDLAVLASDVAANTWKLALESNMVDPGAGDDIGIIEFAAIPANAKMIKIIASDLEFDDTLDSVTLAAGTSSGYAGVTFNGKYDLPSGGPGVWSPTEADILKSGDITDGIIDLVRFGNSNKWSIVSNFDKRSNGSVSLPSPLTRIKLSAFTNGSDLFIAGNVAIWYM